MLHPTDVLLLVILVWFMGIIFGLRINVGLRAFVMRRNEILENELADMRESSTTDTDDADWWKKNKQ